MKLSRRMYAEAFAIAALAVLLAMSLFSSIQMQTQLANQSQEISDLRTKLNLMQANYSRVERLLGNASLTTNRALLVEAPNSTIGAIFILELWNTGNVTLFNMTATLFGPLGIAIKTGQGISMNIPLTPANLEPHGIASAQVTTPVPCFVGERYVLTISALTPTSRFVSRQNVTCTTY